MKTIGIIVAIREEIVALKRKFNSEKTMQILGMTFHIGIKDEAQVIFVQGGDGQQQASLCTQVLINTFEADYIVATGMASGIYPELCVGDIVIGTDHTNEDQIFGETNKWLGDLSEQLIASFDTTKKIYKGTIESQDSFTGEVKVIEENYSINRTYISEMEGAGIAYTCMMNKTPFVNVKVISDTVMPKEEVEFNDFLHETGRLTGKFVWELVSQMISF